MAALLGALMVAGGWLLSVRPVGDERVRAQLHQVATGIVTRVEPLDDVYTRLTVEWRDYNEVSHTSRFDTDTYPWSTGEYFDVRYDSEALYRAARPDDPYYTNNGELRTTARVQGGSLAAAGLGFVLGPGLLALRRRAWRRSLGRGEILTWDQIELPSAPPYAWDSREVPWRWHLYGMWATRFVVVGAVAGLLAGVVLVEVHRSDARLVASGVRARGTVVRGGGYGSRYAQSWVRVTYVDRQEHLHRGVLHGPSPDDLAKGTRIEVVYDPNHPTRFRTNGYANHSNLIDHAMFLLPIGSAGLLLTSCWVLVTVRFGRRLMKRSPWVPAKVVEEDERRAFMYTNYLDLAIQVPGEPRVRTRLGMASKNAIALFHVDEGQTIWVCPGQGRRFLVDADSLPRPFVALLPRSVRQSRRWAKVAQ